MALTKLVDKIAHELDKNVILLVSFLDLSKTFDHNIDLD